ncbi:hypothetical protein QCA50_005747 [Cerrena zonata]|uniref:Uncharacterized protein n=1 Tax=Cerrena zonata TaxID=2478898 RepID=A0AAW0GK64_9APHY
MALQHTSHTSAISCFIFGCPPLSAKALNALATFVSHLDESIIDHEDLFNTALVEDNRVEDFADAIGFLFMEDNCDPEGRFSLLLVHHCAVHFCKEFTELEKERFEDGRITAMHRVGYMCQRLFCMPDSDDLVAEIVKGLYIVRDTIHMGDISPESVGPFFEELQYFEITAKVYALCAAQGHHEHIDLLINVAQSYMAVHHFYLQKTRDLEAAHAMKRAVSRLWRPILEELQSMPLDDEGLVARAKESWVRFGSCAGLRPEKYDPIEEEAIMTGGWAATVHGVTPELQVNAANIARHLGN